ncbi:uncharacterized protein LY89DRAFT_210584 [Mollisia scopiformis]|uniref:Uncharacterized protein n=1 Tax=Mollisia scopiformis TaxID=149040 RepID=A0A194WYA1_MOLSC|nr:uncharacterized protein LY89DRAFT_210584 [Mollisia scopiformis]KUJ12582.1 hypothetical protein LY89DRAFT_210584 [Mollisia scopiformis]
MLVEPNHQHNIRGRTISEYIKALEHPPELPSNMNNLGSAVRNWMHSTHDYMITMHNKLEELRKCLMISTCQHPKTTSLPEKRASEYQVNTSSSDTECPGESKEDPYRETNWRNGFEGWDSMGDISCGDWEQAPVGSVGEVTDLEYQVVTGAGHAQDLGDRVQTLFKENQRKWGKTSIGYVVGGDAKNGLHPPDSPAMKEQRVKAAEARMRRAGATTMGRNFNRRGFESSAAKGGQHARLLPRDSHANDEENEVPENANEGSRSDQNEAGTDTPRPEHGQDEVPCQDSDIPDLVSDNEGHAEAPKFKKTPIISGINDARRREEERREDPEKWYAGWDRWIEGRPNVSNENLQEFMEDRGVPREDIEKLLKGRKRGG